MVFEGARRACCTARCSSRHFHGRRTVRLWTDDGSAGARRRSTRSGHVPLPPYIKRADAATDRDRYQTVYARERGSIAAPTAGLHFTPALLDGARRARASSARHHAARRLRHVPAGARRARRGPPMEREHYDVSAAAAAALTRGASATGRRDHRRRHDDDAHAGVAGARAGRRGRGRHAARPTSSSRRATSSSVVGGLITNFHLPQSSLLMLVSAFAGRDRDPGGLSGRGGGALSVLQLRRRDADCLIRDGRDASAHETALRRVRSRPASRPIRCASRQSKVQPRAICDAVQAGLAASTASSSRCRRCSRRSDFKDVVEAIVAARSAPARRSSGGWARTCIKTGLSPVLVDLMERGFVSAIATNGAGIIHDFEIALSAARHRRTSTRRSARAPSAWPRKPARS